MTEINRRAANRMIDRALGFSVLESQELEQQHDKLMEQLNARAAARAAAEAATPAPELPACTTFVGTGQRCGECRTHRRLHV